MTVFFHNKGGNPNSRTFPSITRPAVQGERAPLGPLGGGRDQCRSSPGSSKAEGPAGMADREEAEVRVAEETLRAWERDQAQLKADVIDQDTQEWQSTPSFAGLERVGGVDLSYIKGDDTRACASLVVLSYPDLEVLYEDCCMVAVNAPYVAGFLAFREVPFLVEAVQRLERKEPGLRPQLLLVDGNGILHHRGFGIACHLGVLTGLPCVGVAKNLLQVDGLANDELHKEQIQDLQAGGDTFPLLSTSGKILGMALRSYAKSTKPVYVSVGHKMSLLSAVQLVHSCCRYRVPEPIRQADIRSREYIRKHLEAVSASPQPERMSEDADADSEH
ncbi:endonuclease V isoform X1 [Zootoca vivipara]|uniref:endonuclease V isoform X1 n=1 Tax=Zootoca vivipara TaxID=8524 RepID=UPI00293BBCA8|nr:endonuclease V isoform X1 [Zootoca vivipara]